MPAFTINIPIRALDADDVRNAFAKSYGYTEMISVSGLSVQNPISKEEFVRQKCINFILDVVKSYMIKVEEVNARNIAKNAAIERSNEVTQWFDNARAELIDLNNILNNFPQVSALSFTMNKNSTQLVTLLGTDPDNLPLNFIITKQPSKGSLSGASPDFTYTPQNDFYGVDSFNFKAFNGTKYSLESVVNITVDMGIVADSATYNVRKNRSVEIFPIAVGSELELTYNIIDSPNNGLIASGNPLIYTPNINYLGLDTFTFKATDGISESNLATINVYVDDIIAPNLSMQLMKNFASMVALNASNTFGEVLFEIVQQPSNGTLTFEDGIYTYTPNIDYVGPDEIHYRATDEYGTSEIATVSINIMGD